MKQSYYESGQYNVICRKCKVLKSITEYYLRNDKKPSLHCKVCHYEYGKKWISQNRDKLNQRARKRLQNPDMKIKALVATRKWRLRNLSYDAFRQRTRRAIKLFRTPKWADLNQIQEFYKNCPKGFHVDHIIPLNGKNVSGLHVLENLQYLSATENLKKRNLYAIG